jgi:uncharacterized protein (TIGR02147 family)
METRKNKSQKKQDFRFFLQNELSFRCSKNPNYSLRSFARFLSISPSALSAMMNGKRPITEKMKERLGFRMGLSIEQLKNLRAKPHGNSRISKTTHEDHFQQLTIDTFTVISEPYHYALLELMKTQDFHWDSKWISQRLDKTVSEINFAIERLERVGILEKNQHGNLTDTTDGFTTDIREGLSTQAQRRFQENSLKQAISSLQNTPIEFRDNTSITFALNKSDIPKAKKMIKGFRRRFCNELEENSNLNEVYQLTIAFTPLTYPSGGTK